MKKTAYFTLEERADGATILRMADGTPVLMINDEGRLVRARIAGSFEFTGIVTDAYGRIASDGIDSDYDDAVVDAAFYPEEEYSLIDHLAQFDSVARVDGLARIHGWTALACGDEIKD